MTFEEWKAKQEQMHNDYDAENAWNAGAASRQAEINSINQDLNHAFATVETQCKQIDELQKRIDELEAKREGFVLVPTKCTNNMAHAAKSIDARLSAFKYGDVWDAMLSAVEVQ